jgi:hypothetical protein
VEAPARAELPEPVLRRLATCERVTLRVGAPDSARSGRVGVAPLQGALYALVRDGDPLLAAVREDSRAELKAEQGDWLLQLSAHAVRGRRVVGDSRRAELLHWLPEGAAPQDWATIRLQPVHIVVMEGEGSRRQRASGPSRGHVERSPRERWFRVLGGGTAVAVGVACALQVLLSFFLLEAGAPRITGLIVSGLGSALALAGAASWGAAARLARWRVGMGADSGVGPLLEGEVSEAAAWRGGAVAGLVGTALLLGGIGAIAGPVAAGASVLASGAWIAWPAVLARHLFRRVDAAEDTGRA